MAPKTKKKTLTAAHRSYDPAKEQVYKALAAILEGAGIEVRREELKRGHGWKVVSGTCRLFEKSVVFVDRKMTQEDQITFLASKVGEVGVPSGDERLEALPEGIRKLCVEGHAASA